MKSIIGTTKLTQVGFVVEDIEMTKIKWAEFLGVEVPPTQIFKGDYEVTLATYKNKPAPDVYSYLAFFDVEDGVRIELIQPNEAPSTWRDFLNSRGEGIHHIAFKICNTKEVVLSCEQFGMNVEQCGKFPNGKGEYTYFDGMESLKCIVETVENYA